MERPHPPASHPNHLILSSATTAGGTTNALPHCCRRRGTGTGRSGRGLVVLGHHSSGRPSLPAAKLSPPGRASAQVHCPTAPKYRLPRSLLMLGPREVGDPTPGNETNKPSSVRWMNTTWKSTPRFSSLLAGRNSSVTRTCRWTYVTVTDTEVAAVQNYP